jgi:hypothetical protein
MSISIRDELRSLILGILTEIEDRGGFATKTKLLKLLYLADIESFRDSHNTLTGFDWIYHLYGPWSREFDDVLSQLASESAVSLTAGTRPDLDTIFVAATEKQDLTKLRCPISTWLAIRHSVSVWASEPTSHLLNYVYFYTEPMEQAKKGQKIDFSSVKPRSESVLYKRATSALKEGVASRLRRKLLESLEKQSAVPLSFTPPKYDEQFWTSVRTILDEAD